jgi:hypothetical protein
MVITVSTIIVSLLKSGGTGLVPVSFDRTQAFGLSAAPASAQKLYMLYTGADSFTAESVLE